MPLSFFTNSGNSYGSAIPFQRIVEPAQLGFFLNLEQSELLRIQRYNEHWRFYFGRQWLFKREDGEPLITVNYYRKFIDKIVSFMVGKGFLINTADALSNITKPFLDEVWEYNGRNKFAFESATMGAVSGDVFVLITFEEPSVMQQRVNPYSQGHIRLNLLGSEQVYPTWDPLNQDTLIAARIETIYYAERGTRQLDREDRVNHEGRQLYTKRFTQIITRDSIVEQYHGDQPIVRPNLLGEIPLVHIKNLPLPKEYYGLADGQDLIDLQKELNEKSTDISDSINYHSAPVTVIYGAKAKQLERGPRQVWSGLPTDSRVETLKLEGNLTAANDYWDKIKKSMHEIADVPEGSLGDNRPISNTSGVALHMQYAPLMERRDRKLAMYQPGFEQINYFILRVGMVKGLINLPFDICKNCGGRIIQLDTGKTTQVWDSNIEAYIDVPLMKKKCYHIDKETLDFIDAEEMRVKFWRRYGFGRQLMELPYNDLIKEIKSGKRSFWDYTILLEALEKVEKQKLEEEKIAKSPIPEEEVSTEETIPEVPTPKVSPAPDKNKPSPFSIDSSDVLPDTEMEAPEEPERVTVVQNLANPRTNEVVNREPKAMFLVPTGCKNPEYLNPFSNEVRFLDVLPKDEAIRAQLYLQYQAAGWVDSEWCQEHIPEIAVDALEIRRRHKAVQALMASKKSDKLPAGVKILQSGTSVDISPGNAMAPPIDRQDTVPDAEGNPVSITQQR